MSDFTYCGEKICKLYTPCLICGDDVEVFSHHNSAVICDECKDIILFIKDNKHILNKLINKGVEDNGKRNNC